MNEKITLQELVELFAQKCQLNEADAELFVKEFLALIEEALTRDKYVKVKGLGTFKLINIEARKSVDVNTGEAIEIKGHTRVSFIPEAGLRDLINKPFAHFQSVLLKDEVHFADLPEEGVLPEGEEEESESDTDTTETDVVSSSIEQQPEASCPEVAAVPSVEEKEEPAEAADTETLVQEMNIPEADAAVPEREKERHIPWCMIASILLVGIFIGGLITWTLTSGRRYVPEEVVEYLMQQKHQQKVAPVVSDSSKVADTLTVKVDSSQIQRGQRPDTVKQEQKVVTATPAQTRKNETTAGVPAKRETLADTVEYQITGTQASYTLRPGESLVRVALKFYGNKKLWPYLVKHNKSIIKNPDNVPVGTTIQIPQLTPKK